MNSFSEANGYFGEKIDRIFSHLHKHFHPSTNTDTMDMKLLQNYCNSVEERDALVERFKNKGYTSQIQVDYGSETVVFQAYPNTDRSTLTAAINNHNMNHKHIAARARLTMKLQQKKTQKTLTE